MKKGKSRWLVLGLLWLAAAGCGDDAPTAPTAAPNFAGTWVGTGQLQQCTGTPALCAQATPNATAPVEFVLAQTGAAVSGTFTINGAEPRIAITGSVASDGSLNLSGRPAGAPAVVDSSRLTVAGAAMSGTLTYSLSPPNPAQSPASITIGLQGVTRR